MGLEVFMVVIILTTIVVIVFKIGTDPLYVGLWYANLQVTRLPLVRVVSEGIHPFGQGVFRHNYNGG